MPDILIKQVPEGLHTKLRDQARRHGRSMNQEVLAILAKKLGTEIGTEVGTDVRDFPPPFKGKRLVTQSMITEGIHEGRT